MNYKLEIIPGTKYFVAEEIKEKLENSEIISKTDEEIIVKWHGEFIDLRRLKSPLRASDGTKTINLFRRKWKEQTHPAGINPSLAYILCMIAKVSKKDTVLDPFCGAGTIAITASKYFRAKKTFASDVSGDSIDMTTKNYIAANLNKKIFVTFRSNVSNLRLNENSISKIITNPPFGVRTGNHEDNIKIYNDFFEVSKKLLRRNGKIILLTQEKLLVEELCNKHKLKISDNTQVSQGGLHPDIFTILN